MVYEGQYPVPYEDLSGGQGQLVNIAIAFAIHDVVAADNVNLLILDEVFESLSSGNVEIVSSVISDKSADKSLFLITHQQDFTPQGAKVMYVSRGKLGTSLE
jgi:DNA repair exonuclease SbcCD ATPase subunit